MSQVDNVDSVLFAATKTERACSFFGTVHKNEKAMVEIPAAREQIPFLGLGDHPGRRHVLCEAARNAVM